MIHLDTSLLVDALTGPRDSAPALERTIASGERINLSSVVLYEWLRGPRLPADIARQEALFPNERSVPFGAREAEVVAILSRTLARPRGRDIDFTIAACALTHQAILWTLDPDDFDDIPGLKLFTPPRTRG